MIPITAEEAAKGLVIERCRDRYEFLGGRWEGERFKEAEALPMPYLAELAEVLDTVYPKTPRNELSLIVQKIIHKYKKACSDKERAKLDSLMPPASIDFA